MKNGSDSSACVYLKKYSFICIHLTSFCYEVCINNFHDSERAVPYLSQRKARENVCTCARMRVALNHD